MLGSGNVRVTLPADQLRRLEELVAAGEFSSRAAVMREALRQWLRHRSEGRIGRSFARTPCEPPYELTERVELLFDAGDCKA
jgi:hypothetical protein